ncbi:hypothetical protein COU15_01735 [Candidatus Kaiserbacteria bacterium CG10_big_fil_rev_8_21_14_0_10_45_20]|uniref:Alpha/beta hydrolase n=1 Tax=Candidatus Kaiserbacteria bacterium CG10_big_fil_rev_8_21_14_0_10_45_20 TaxID=1974607 RepID=A0A2H0UFQ4_9BACT|nr:MAG: hypothetical protein COU15_01735 [Candidatus Kaiserbacteria bacterium CG10_big_fil_rev_8_21_14_0_10_45_20]
MQKQQVIVVHGGGSYAGIPRETLVEELKNKEIDLERLRRKEDWKAELRFTLGDAYDVLYPTMPNRDLPLYAEWEALFDRVLDVVDTNIILVGHSLGGMFLMKYFSEHTVQKKVKGLFSVSAPYNGEGDRWRFEKSNFIVGDDLSNIQRADSVFLYHSHDDRVVPFSELEKYKEKLPDAVVRELDGRGHFNTKEFPEIVEDIRGLGGL